MTNPVMVIEGALPALLSAHKAAMRTGLPAEVGYLVHLRASQINGCSHCTEMHARELKDAGSRTRRSGRWARGANRRTSAPPSAPRSRWRSR